MRERNVGAVTQKNAMRKQSEPLVRRKPVAQRKRLDRGPDLAKRYPAPRDTACPVLDLVRGLQRKPVTEITDRSHSDITR